jgi:hypothetical protein
VQPLALVADCRSAQFGFSTAKAAEVVDTASVRRKCAGSGRLNVAMDANKFGGSLNDVSKDTV